MVPCLTANRKRSAAALVEREEEEGAAGAE